jgi:hypothetical protein
MTKRDLPCIAWRTSSYSSNAGPNCVELGALSDGVAVRDSKHRDGAILHYSPADWASFIAAAKSGGFDLAG